MRQLNIESVKRDHHGGAHHPAAHLANERDGHGADVHPSVDHQGCACDNDHASSADDGTCGVDDGPTCGDHRFNPPGLRGGRAERVGTARNEEHLPAGLPDQGQHQHQDEHEDLPRPQLGQLPTDRPRSVLRNGKGGRGGRLSGSPERLNLMRLPGKDGCDAGPSAAHDEVDW
jgi:hypothetical protein